MSDSEKVLKLGLRREPEWLLYVTGSRVYRVKMRGGPPPEVVMVTNIRQDPAYVYYVDAEGDVARSRRVRAEASTRELRARRRP
jgi:hypothetical protein